MTKLKRNKNKTENKLTNKKKKKGFKKEETLSLLGGSI